MGLLVAGDSLAAYKSLDRTNFTATANQTTFTLSQGYSVGDVDVFLNGIKLVEGDDYYATNGSTVVLTTGAVLGDTLSVISYNNFLAANTYTKSETDSRYMVASGINPMTSYLRAPNYGVSSWSDSATASLEASVGSGEQGVGVKAFGRSISTTGGDLLYTSDTRGAGGRHRFGRWNGTTFTSDLTIDSAGRITAPNQPSFLYFCPGGFSDVTTTSTKLNVYSSLGYARGTGYDPAQSRFTAPIAGVYLFRVQAWCPPSATLGSVTFRLNGTTQYGEARCSKNTTTANYNSLNLVVQMYLSVNDYVEVWTGPDSGGTVHLSSGSSYSGFSGHLLG